MSKRSWHPFSKEAADAKRDSSFSLHGLPPPDRPHVVGEIPVGEILVRHCEVALHSPGRAPRVAHDEAPLRIVIAHCEYGVATGHALTRLGRSEERRVGEEGRSRWAPDH